MQPFTKAQNKGMYDLYIVRYRKANILKNYGLSWKEFMDLPYDIAHKLLDDSEVAAKEAAELINHLPEIPE